jgi:hypothetical protein
VPEDKFKGKERNYVFINNRYKRLKNIFYIKHDCSVYDGSSSCGVEFNTHPFNWNWFIKNKKCFYDLGKFLEEQKYRCNRTCGFHVHINKSFFKDKEHIYRFLYMFYRDPRKIKNISKRGNSSTLKSYANPWIDKKLLKRKTNRKSKIILQDIKDLFGDKGWLKGLKDIAVNTYHKKTIEVRIFQSTINPLLFASYLEYCMALAIYTKNKNNKLTIDNFKRYTIRNKRKYPNLLKACLFTKCNLVPYKSAVSSIDKSRFWGNTKKY